MDKERARANDLFNGLRKYTDDEVAKYNTGILNRFDESKAELQQAFSLIDVRLAELADNANGGKGGAARRTGRGAAGGTRQDGGDAFALEDRSMAQVSQQLEYVSKQLTGLAYFFQYHCKTLADAKMELLFHGDRYDDTTKHDALIWFYRHTPLMPGRALRVVVKGFQAYAHREEYPRIKHASVGLGELAFELHRVERDQLSSGRLQVLDGWFGGKGEDGKDIDLLGALWPESMFSRTSCYQMYFAGKQKQLCTLMTLLEPTLVSGAVLELAERPALTAVLAGIILAEPVTAKGTISPDASVQFSV